MPPPAEHRSHEVLRVGERDVLERAEHLDAGGVEAGLLPRLAERRGDRTVVSGIDASARERDLAGMGSQRRCAREQQHVEVARHRARPARRGRSAASRARRTGSARRRGGSRRPRADRRVPSNPSAVARCGSAAAGASCSRALCGGWSAGIRSGYAGARHRRDPARPDDRGRDAEPRAHAPATASWTARSTSPG